MTLLDEYYKRYAEYLRDLKKLGEVKMSGYNVSVNDKQEPVLDNLPGVSSMYPPKDATQEGKKNDQGKPRMELLPGPSLIEVAKVMSFGASKYGDYNWASGIKYTRVLGAILRHVFSYIAGESTDPETGLSHMAHAACGCLFILFYEKYRAEFDDRYQNDNNKK